MLEIIDSLGLRPDMVVGTSIGAIIGGLYASGYSGTQIDSLAAHAADRDDDPARTSRKFRRRSARCARSPCGRSGASRIRAAERRRARGRGQRVPHIADAARKSQGARKLRFAADSVPRGRDRCRDARAGRDRNGRSRARRARERGDPRRAAAGADRRSVARRRRHRGKRAGEGRARARRAARMDFAAAVRGAGSKNIRQPVHHHDACCSTRCSSRTR